MREATGRAVAAIGGIGRDRGDERHRHNRRRSGGAGCDHPEIARNVAEAARGTGAVTGTIDEVARAADDTGAAATRMFASAASLSEQSAELRREIDAFLETVRAA